MAVQTIATLKTNMPVNTAGAISAQDINDLIDTTEDRTTQEVATRTANYTAVAGDNRRRIVFNSASAVTFTLPNNLPVGWECSILQIGAGQVTVAVASGGALRHPDSHTKLSKQYAQGYVWVYANTGTAAQVAFTGDTAA